MNGDYEGVDVRSGAPPGRGWLVYLVLAGLCFSLGVAAAGWLLSRWEAGAQLLGIAPEPAPVAQATAPEPQVDPLVEIARTPTTTATSPTEPQRIVIDPEITRRVAALEQRVGQVDNQSRSAVGNADRAEGLLVAFAARRALDRGVALGFLEALLRQRFGNSQPQAVGTIIAAAREPVTLQELQDGLQALGPQLVGAGPEQGWWDAIRAELGSMIIVRREGTPSPVPAERLRRATRRLEAGQVDVTLAEVMRLPGRDIAREWALDARRYVLARRALDVIETAALLEPRTAPAQAAAPARAPQPQPLRSQPGR